MNQSKQCGLRRLEQLQAIPFLLVDIAYLCKLFLQKFTSTSLPTQDIPPSDTDKALTVVTNSSGTSHLQ
ncbi:unnamed protein product [Rotaria socialis]